MSGSKRPRTSPDPPPQDHPGSGSRVTVPSSSANSTNLTLHSPTIATNTSHPLVPAPATPGYLDSEHAAIIQSAREILTRCGDPVYPSAHYEISHLVRNLQASVDGIRSRVNHELKLRKRSVENAEDEVGKKHFQVIVDELEERDKLLNWSVEVIGNISTLGKLKQLLLAVNEMKEKDRVPFNEHRGLRRRWKDGCKSVAKPYEFDNDFIIWLTGSKLLPNIDVAKVNKWIEDLTTGQLSLEDEKRTIQTREKDVGDTASLSVDNPDAFDVLWKAEILSNVRMVDAISDAHIRDEIAKVYAEIELNLDIVKGSGKVEPEQRVRKKGGSGGRST
jgi:hypothetical protein